MLADIAAAVRRRRLSAVELVEESLRRIDRHNGDLNAVIALRADAAREDARRLDARVAAGEDVGPLAGLPLLVKEVDDVAGLPTTNGSRLLADAPPAARDGRVPRLLQAAGAIVVGKTNIPEFCYEGYSANPLFGATRNPWGLEWSPGGSSGGSGAALAAGLAAIATGTDGGGSVRIPAAFCGLVGLKPTNGLVGRGSVPAWLDLSTDGPLAHTMADLELLLGLIAGAAAGDYYAAASGSPAFAAATGLPDRFMSAPHMVASRPLAAPVQRLFDAALQALAEATGIAADQIASGHVFSSEQIDEDWYTLTSAEQAQELGRRAIEDNAGLFDPTFLQTMQEGLEVSADEYIAARRRRFGYAREVDDLLGERGVLVTPTMTVEGFLADGRMSGVDVSAPPEPTPGWAYNTNPANMTGHPALSLPAGRCPNGLPFGLQLMAPRWRDDILVEVGRRWEAARPWPAVADGYDAFAY